MQTTSHYLSNLLTRLYVITLNGIALLVICGQLTVQHALDKRFNDGRLIEVACQQSVLVETLSKCALAIDASDNKLLVEHYAKEMEQALNDLDRNSEILKLSTFDSQLPGSQATEDEIVFKDVESDFQVLLKASRAMVANSEVSSFAPDSRHKQSVYTLQILEAAPPFSKGMKSLVASYQSGSQARIEELQNTEFSILLATILSLILAGAVIFRPAIKQIRAAIQLLELTQNKLSVNEARLSAILNNMAEGVIVIDRNGDCLLINEAARRIHSMPPAAATEAKDLEFKSRFQFFHADARTPISDEDLPLYLALQGNEVDKVELYLQPTDRSLMGFWVLGTSRPMLDVQGRIVGALVVMQDITERKMAEKRFSQFYSAAARELRAPLMAIRESLSVIEWKKSDLSREVQDKVHVGQFETERLVQLINEVLDLRRLELGTLELDYEKFKIKSVFSEAISEATKAHENFHKNSRISINVSVDDLIVEADKGRIKLVLQNLVANALNIIENGIVEVAAYESGEYLRVAVVDRGYKRRSDITRTLKPFSDNFLQTALGTKSDGRVRGVVSAEFIEVNGANNSEHRKREHVELTQETIETVEAVETEENDDAGSRGGSGLGLSVCKRIVERHGGRMGFDVDTNKGSTFWFEVPLCRPKAKISMNASANSIKAMHPIVSSEKS